MVKVFKVFLGDHYTGNSHGNTIFLKRDFGKNNILARRYFSSLALSCRCKFREKNNATNIKSKEFFLNDGLKANPMGRLFAFLRKNRYNKARFIILTFAFPVIPNELSE